MTYRRFLATFHRPSGFTLMWVFWIATFGVIEGIALARPAKGDTLSEHVWRWFHVADQDVPWWRLLRAVLAGFCVWLGIHFVGGGRLM